MKTNIFFILLLITVTHLISCKKIPKDTEIGVSGNATAENVNGPIPGGQILIVEYTQGMYGPRPSAIIDSTTTDENGHYAITVRATGNGTSYRFRFRTPDGYISNPDMDALLEISKYNTVNFTGTKLSVLKADYSVLNNPYPPLSIETGYYYFGRHTYYINNNDTTVYMYVVPGATNDINYSVTTDDTPRVTRRSYGKITLEGMQDTFEASFTIDVDTFR